MSLETSSADNLTDGVAESLKVCRRKEKKMNKKSHLQGTPQPTLEQHNVMSVKSLECNPILLLLYCSSQQQSVSRDFNCIKQTKKAFFAHFHIWKSSLMFLHVVLAVADVQIWNLFPPQFKLREGEKAVFYQKSKFLQSFCKVCHDSHKFMHVLLESFQKQYHFQSLI